MDPTFAIPIRRMSLLKYRESQGFGRTLGEYGYSRLNLIAEGTYSSDLYRLSHLVTPKLHSPLQVDTEKYIEDGIIQWIVQLL
jgi:hypothetical protein